MTQPPNGPYGSDDNKDNTGWGPGPGDGPDQPRWGGPTPSEPTWGGPAGPEPTWSGTPGPDWGSTPPPANQPPTPLTPPYEPTSEYRPGPYGAGDQPAYGATTPPPYGPGAGGYGTGSQGPKPASRRPWIAGIAAAAVIVIVLAVVLFVTLGGDDSTPGANVPATTSSQSPQAEAESQIEESIRTYTIAFTDEDWDTALAVTCGQEQSAINDLQADSSVELNDMKMNSVTGIEITGDQAETTVSLTYIDPTDQSPVKTSRFTFSMEKRLGTWKVCNTREI